MNYNIATILAAIAILFVLLTYITGAPLAVILLGLAIIFGTKASKTTPVFPIPTSSRRKSSDFPQFGLTPIGESTQIAQ